jgi:hypothetical protein
MLFHHHRESARPRIRVERAQETEAKEERFTRRPSLTEFVVAAVSVAVQLFF